MSTFKVGDKVTRSLAVFAQHGYDGLLDLVVSHETGKTRYSKLRLVQRCCGVESDADGRIKKITIVARGDDGPGPFLFLWPPGDVSPNQAACLGLPLVDAFAAS